MIFTKVIQTPVGKLAISEENGAVILCAAAKNASENLLGANADTPLLDLAAQQLQDYFSGKRRCFSLPLRLTGTPFRKAVLQALLEIPYGETRTYGEIARSLGNPRACRAVGQAVHANPLLVFVPCHRVIGADGSLTGYAAGIDIKEALLHLESAAKLTRPQRSDIVDTI